MGNDLCCLRGVVAGILERERHGELDPQNRGGGIRTVVTDEPWTLYDHIQPGERLFMVPNYTVPIPVPYEIWPHTVGAAEIFTAVSIWPERLKRWGVWEAEKYFNIHVANLMNGRHNRPPDWWQRPSDWATVEAGPGNSCGGCTACCKTPYIDAPGLRKPSHQMCQHCTGVGCGIYDKRPEACREFRCLWLRSQNSEQPMAAELRPDRCHVIFTETDDPLIFDCHIDKDYLDAAHVGVARAWIDRQQASGKKARLVTFYHGED